MFITTMLFELLKAKQLKKEKQLKPNAHEHYHQIYTEKKSLDTAAVFIDFCEYVSNSGVVTC